MENNSLGSRMKQYEEVNLHYLVRRMPLIIRVDGKAFHTLTRKLGFQKPFDKNMMLAMIETAKGLLEEIQGSKLAYIQSDEISVLATDYENIDTQAWFDKNLQKMVSISASVASVFFNDYIFPEIDETGECGFFDSRSLVLPKEEVCNYFIWRQKDCSRNSIQGLGQASFSHKAMAGLNNDQVQEKLFQEKQINWNNIDTWKKRGVCLYKDKVIKTIDTKVVERITDNGKQVDYNPNVIRTKIVEDWEIPIFTQDRNYIEKWI